MGNEREQVMGHITPIENRAEFWKNRTVLVTGSEGFVGKWLVKRLGELGARVDGMDVVRLWGDVRQRENIRINLRHDVKTVFHLAAVSQVKEANANPADAFDNNIRGTWTLLDTIREFPTVEQTVVASSDKSYGESPTLPYTENTPLRGVYPYDCSKACTDLIAQCYAKSYGLPIAIARMGNIYGGGDMNWNRIVPSTIRAVLQGENPVIRSDGTPIRDYFYVEDAVDAYLCLAEGLAEGTIRPGEAFNFSNDEPLSVREIAAIIVNEAWTQMLQHGTANYANHPYPIKILNEASNEIQAQHLSFKKARARLGWTPNHSLTEGLQKTVAWYKDYLKGKHDTSVLP